MLDRFLDILDRFLDIVKYIREFSRIFTVKCSEPSFSGSSMDDLEKPLHELSFEGNIHIFFCANTASFKICIAIYMLNLTMDSLFHFCCSLIINFVLTEQCGFI